jgi:hypothetical protein
MSTMNVLDASGATVAVEKPLTPGRAAAAASRPVALSNEDLAALQVLGGMADAAWASGSGSLVALLKAIATNAISTSDSPVEPHQPCDVISFTPTLDTAIYASGDVLFATAPITITRANDLRALLTSLTVIDKSKQTPAFTLLFYQTNVTSAAANAANNLSDADQANLLGYVNILSADYLTFANNSVLCYSGSKAPNVLLEAATGTQLVYVVGILQAGTPTFAVGDLVLKLGVVQQ